MAEEGSKYFANAYKYGFFYSFFFIEFSSGYLNFWANISAIVANSQQAILDNNFIKFKANHNK